MFVSNDTEFITPCGFVMARDLTSKSKILCSDGYFWNVTSRNYFGRRDAKLYIFDNMFSVIGKIRHFEVPVRGYNFAKVVSDDRARELLENTDFLFGQYPSELLYCNKGMMCYVFRVLDSAEDLVGVGVYKEFVDLLVRFGFYVKFDGDCVVINPTDDRVVKYSDDDLMHLFGVTHKKVLYGDSCIKALAYNLYRDSGVALNSEASFNGLVDCVSVKTLGRDMVLRGGIVVGQE